MPAPKARHVGRWIEPMAMIVFAIACLVLGGSSRRDAPVLLLLRPVVVCCLVVFAARLTRFRLAAVKGPSMLLAAFAVTIAIQLVPIPATIWAMLQGRAPYAAALAGVGLGAQAHPLSLTPDATWNSLVALLVPAAMLLGYAAVGRETRRAMLPALIVGAMVSAILGIAQIAAGQESALYFYRATNDTFPVGVFANRNHEAAFLAIMFPALRAWTLEAPDRKHGSIGVPRKPIALGIGLFLVPMILATGSRAGFALMLLGLGAAWAIAPVALPRARSRGQRWAILAGAASIALLIGLTIASGRAVTLQRLIENHDPTNDLRVAYLPTMIGLIHRFWLFGAGFGSFDPILRGGEPDALLHGMYFNNAHDDLIELALNGGVPSILVLIAFLIWWLRSGFAAFAAPGREAGVYIARAAASMIGLLLIASLLDYPLRTPLIGAVFALLCVWLHRSPGASLGLPVARVTVKR